VAAASACVEILYPPDLRVKRRYHLSFNVTICRRSRRSGLVADGGFERMSGRAAIAACRGGWRGIRVAYIRAAYFERAALSACAFAFVSATSTAVLEGPPPSDPPRLAG